MWIPVCCGSSQRRGVPGPVTVVSRRRGSGRGPGRRVQHRGGPGPAGQADRLRRRRGRPTGVSAAGAGSAAAMIAKRHVGCAAYRGGCGAIGRGSSGPGGRGGVVTGRGGTVLLARRPRLPTARCEHRGDGARGHAVAGGSPPRPAAFRRAGGHDARWRSPGGRVHGGSGAGTAERAVTARFQP